MASEHDDRRAAERTQSMTFGDFRVLRGDQRLLRNGEEVRLDPKAWDLLCCLVDHAGKVLSKEDLLALVWKKVVVSDAALSQTISRLRSALGDDTRSPRYIETLHRRGIRFIAPVQRDGDARGNAAAPAGSIFMPLTSARWSFAFGPVSKMTDAPSSGTKDQLASAEGLMVPSSMMKRTITSRLVSGASKIVFEALISGKLPPPPAL